ncbi:hypothetical protein IT413_05820 [Candidatus Peregrinibacteria bacterium]|nr:hypothetical protein [Candidatus Peregrinibacteria bacterium]
MPENTLQDDIKKYINPWKGFVKRRAKGILKHDYLVPGGPYEEQWDWDAFFVGMALSAEIPTEAVFLKNWALNYLESADDTGYVPGCLVPAGFDPRLKQMKPFMAQGCYFASRSLNDFEWLKDETLYQKLIKVVMYRENHGCFDKELNLGGWTNSMESGADNNLASLDYPDNSVASVDFNSFLYLEYKSLSLISRKTGRIQDAQQFEEKAENLKKAILEKMWDKTHGTFYNINLKDKSFITVVSYSSVHPFWAGIATQEQADTFFKNYLLNPNKMLSPYGIRTQSKDHAGYNNVNMIKPYSNWQGPIWPIATYIYVQSLMNYGYEKEAREIAEKVIKLCIQDIQKSGGMHENYDAETGEPLAAPNFVSWNLLLVDVLNQIDRKENPFQLLR